MLNYRLNFDAPNSDKNWKRKKDWAPARLGSKNEVLVYLRLYYEMKFSFKWLTINLFLNERAKVSKGI